MLFWRQYLFNIVAVYIQQKMTHRPMMRGRQQNNRHRHDSAYFPAAAFARSRVFATCAAVSATLFLPLAHAPDARAARSLRQRLSTRRARALGAARTWRHMIKAPAWLLRAAWRLCSGSAHRFRACSRWLWRGARWRRPRFATL